MKPVYNVRIYYTPSKPSDRKRDLADYYHQFASFMAAKMFILTLSAREGLNIRASSVKNRDNHFGGLIGEWNKDQKKNVFANHSISLKKGYLFADIVAEITSGKIRIIDQGHNHVILSKTKILPELKERLAAKLEHNLKSAENLPDNSYALDAVHFPIGIGDTFEIGAHCWDCDCSLDGILIDEGTVVLVDRYKTHDIRDKDHKILDARIVPVCPLKELKLKDRVVTEIEVSTGQMVIANAFRQDSLYKRPDEYKIENSISGLMGRVGLARHYEGLNVGYGQMGNMSMCVYRKDDGTELIFGPEYDFDDAETDGEAEVSFPGFKRIGESISLAVWRWMCADKTVLAEHGEKIPKGLRKNGHKEEDYRDFVLADVVPGRWVIEHYYDIGRFKDKRIYSKLYLKNRI